MNSIRAEFIKTCKSALCPDISLVLNCITQLQDFPKLWTEGLRTAVLKSGCRLNTGNYRGITIVPIIEKKYLK